jgi:hypothetical protein
MGNSAKDEFKSIKFKLIKDNIVGKYIIINTATETLVTDNGRPVVFYSKSFAEKYLAEFKPFGEQSDKQALIAQITAADDVEEACLCTNIGDIGKMIDGFSAEDCNGLCSDCEFYSECEGELLPLIHG